MNNFIIHENGKDYVVESVSDNYKDWKVIKQESYKLNKEEIVLEAFNKDFDFDIKDYTELTEVCARSEVLTKWLINANLLYSEQADLPLFLKDVVTPTEYKNVSENLTMLNKTYSEYSDKKKRLSENYKRDLKKIEIEEKKKVDEITNKNKLIKVLAMNSTALPITLQILINRYVPNDKDNVQESQRAFGREVLVNYQRQLCNIINDNPDIDIESIIESNKIK